MANKNLSRDVRGIKNPNYRNGNRIKQSCPCPQCGAERICEKRHANKLCRKCCDSNRRTFNLSEWYKKTRKESKEYAISRLGGFCVMCGVMDLPTCCYHFHHKNPINKSFSVGSKFNQKINRRIIKEIDKCELLCANCHAIKTWLGKKK